MISLVITIPALAIPSLPASFYGTAKVNAANVPDGTVIQALVGGQVIAEGFTQTYQGDSVYALDVPGDNTDTETQDGGREGDSIQFKIGGALADQTAVWHTGTNVNLNLTAPSSGPVATPQATPSPVSTQTAIVLIQPSPIPVTPILATIVPASSTPATLAQPSQVATQQAQPSQIATRLAQPLPMPTSPVQPSPTSAASENEKDNGSGNIAQVAFPIIALVVAIIAGYIFLVFRKKM
jgi:hypothetical protein